jgi:taurine dioxygenase
MKTLLENDMKITPMATGFGALVEGIDLKEITDHDANGLRAALLEHGLLIAHKQNLSPQEQISVSETFGALESFPPSVAKIPGLPQIFRVASRATDGNTDVGRYWHSDGSFKERVTPISIWYLVEQPKVGGDTLFTDLQLAYEELPAPMKTEIGQLITAHHNGIRHPLVLAHPKTKKLGIYLNVGLTGGIVGLEPDKSAMLIKKLDAHFSRPGAVYTHEWQVGDFVVADNFHVAHKATPISAEYRRILNRTTVRSDGVRWFDKDIYVADQNVHA